VPSPISAPFAGFLSVGLFGRMSGNSADISKGYFDKPIGGSNPLWSASKSLILQQKISVVELRRHSRWLAPTIARVGH
jgi:hypothetical protein